MLFPMNDVISLIERPTKDGLNRITREHIADDVKCYFADLATTVSFVQYRVNEKTTSVVLLSLSDHDKLKPGDELTVDGTRYQVQRQIPMKDLFGIVHGYVFACQDLA